MSKESEDLYEVAWQNLEPLIKNPDTPKEVLEEALAKISEKTEIPIITLKVLFLKKEERQ